MSLGSTPIVAVIGFVLVTLACGALMSCLLGRRMAFGLFAGGSPSLISRTSVTILRKETRMSTIMERQKKDGAKSFTGVIRKQKGD